MTQIYDPAGVSPLEAQELGFGTTAPFVKLNILFSVPA